MSTPTQPSDGSILAEVLDGKRDQFAEIVERYQTRLLRVATSRLGDATLAEDVVQETFLCAFKSLASYDSKYSFRTWLWTILLNQCRRAYGRRQRTPKVNMWSDGVDGVEEDQVKADVESGESTPAMILLAKEESQRIEQLLAELPDREADALRLRFFGGLKFQEIADTMQCSLSTAKNRVRWGLTKMSQRLIGEIDITQFSTNHK